MTRIIRADLEGVVHAYRGDGSVGAVLSAGDVVPDGVVVGDHLIDTATAEAADPVPAPVPVRTQTPEQSDTPATGAHEDDESGDSDELDDEPGDDEPSEGEDAEDADADQDGDDLGDDQPGEDGDAEGLAPPRGNASTEAWAEYADALGVEIEPGATRAQIQAAIDASKD